MTQLESTAGRRDPATLPVVTSTVKHAGNSQVNPVLPTVSPNTSHAGGNHL